MSMNQQPCSPLHWENQFQKLLKDMSVAIHEMDGTRKVTLARYQTAIAIGCYLGPRAKELRTFIWNDFIGKSSKDLFEFKTEKHRKIHFNEKLIRLLHANYKIIDPINIHDYILQSPSHPGKAISTRAFNKGLLYWFKYFGIKTDNPSSHTLRKTFAQRVFKNRGASEEALIFVSEILNHSTTAYTRKYLGIRRNQIREAYLTID